MGNTPNTKRGGKGMFCVFCGKKSRSNNAGSYPEEYLVKCFGCHKEVMIQVLAKTSKLRAK
jgi:hypothetical protein